MKRASILVVIFLFFLKAFSQSQSESEKARIKSFEILNTVFKPSSTRVRFEYVSTIERIERYSIKYKVIYSDLNYTGSLFIDINRKFELYDSAFYYEIPDFILQNSKVDLISADSALNIAKRNGLCLEDVLDIRLLRHYEKKYFMWFINTDSSKDKAAAKKKYKTKTTIRAVIPCRERIVDARTGEIIPNL